MSKPNTTEAVPFGEAHLFLCPILSPPPSQHRRQDGSQSPPNKRAVRRTRDVPPLSGGKVQMGQLQSKSFLGRYNALFTTRWRHISSLRGETRPWKTPRRCGVPKGVYGEGTSSLGDHTFRRWSHFSWRRRLEHQRAAHLSHDEPCNPPQRSLV